VIGDSGLATTKLYGLLLIATVAVNASAADDPSTAKMNRLLHSLSGVWRYTVKSPSSSQHLNGGVTTGVEVWRTSPGGTPLIEENQMTIDGKDYYDYAAIWWNGKMQDLQGIWCDTEMNDQGCTNFAVTWEGEQIVMTGEYESAGKKFAWRETLARNSEHSLTQTLYVGQPGRDLKLVSTISLAKN